MWHSVTTVIEAGRLGEEKISLIYRIYEMGPFFTTFKFFWENSRFLAEVD